MTKPSFHDVVVTTDRLPRTLLSEMPHGFELICSRLCGWQLWFHAHDDIGGVLSTCIAAEFPKPGKAQGLKIEVGEAILCDSLAVKPQ